MLKNKLKSISQGILLTGLALQTGLAYSAVKSDRHTVNRAELEASLGAFNKNEVDVTVRIPAKQAYGFDDKAVTPEQKSQVDTVVDTLKKNISHIVTVRDTTDCTYDVSNINPYDDLTEKRTIKNGGKNEEVKAKYWVLKAEVSVKCGEDLRGKVLAYDFSPDFKNVKNVLVDLSASEKRSFLAKPTGSFSL